jgi:transposase
MPTERLAMRHVRDVMRLKAAGMSSREIARRVGSAPSTVRLTIRRFEASGLTWPLPDDVTDTVLEARLLAKAGSGSRQGQRRLAEPDRALVHRELKRKHVTLSIVWEEYIAGEPGGYRYSRFCKLYRAWEGRLSVTMRQSHGAGDRLLVDYAGDGVPVVIDRFTGERRAAQIFVAVLGASSFTHAQATWTQGLADWIGGHVGAFEAIGGVPAGLPSVRTPPHGGHIERLIRKMMGKVPLLPGTNFSDVRADGDWKSEDTAAMTFDEIERWLAHAIVGIYHPDLHLGIGTTLSSPRLT